VSFCPLYQFFLKLIVNHFGHIAYGFKHHDTYNYEIYHHIYYIYIFSYGNPPERWGHFGQKNTCTCWFFFNFQTSFFLSNLFQTSSHIHLLLFLFNYIIFYYYLLTLFLFYFWFSSLMLPLTCLSYYLLSWIVVFGTSITQIISFSIFLSIVNIFMICLNLVGVYEKEISYLCICFLYLSRCIFNVIFVFVIFGFPIRISLWEFLNISFTFSYYKYLNFIDICYSLHVVITYALGHSIRSYSCSLTLLLLSLLSSFALLCFIFSVILSLIFSLSFLYIPIV